jgi:hypothetical protein
MEVKPDDDILLIGAVEIAEQGFDKKITPQQVYRLAEERDPGWPIFRFRRKLASRRGTLRAEIARREALATGRSS